MCGGCRTAKYCSRACQVADRPEHKLVCEVLGDVRYKSVSRLIFSAGHGDEAMVKILLENGTTKVNKADITFGVTALSIAVGLGHEAVVARLLGAGAKVNKAVRRLGTPGSCTVLNIAAGTGNTMIVAALLDAGARVNAAGFEGMTPIFTAALGGHAAVIAMLLQAGAVVNVATDAHRFTQQRRRAKRWC
jgi:ankyrin repeat protein